MIKFILKFVTFLIVVGGLGYASFYLWQHRYEHFFKGKEIKIQKNIDFKKDANDNWNNQDDNGENGGNNNYADDDYFAPNINQDDCRSECRTRKSVPEEYEYCLEVCGLNEIRDIDIPEIDADNGCGEIENVFKQDVCWKEKAIKEKNDSYCENISDEKMSEICKDRVLEEVIN